MNADESPAQGAALECAILSPLFQVKPFETVDVVHYPVRLVWDAAPGSEEGGDGDDANTLVLFKHGDPTPKTRRVTFRRSDAFTIVASYDGESKQAAELPAGTDTTLARFRVGAVPPADVPENEAPRLRVNIRHDLNGLVSVSSAEYMQEKIEEPEPEPTPEAAAKEGDADTPPQPDAPAKEEGSEAKTTAEGGEEKAAPEGDAKAEDTPAAADGDTAMPDAEAAPADDAAPPADDAAPTAAEGEAAAPAAAEGEEKTAGKKRKRLYRRVHLGVTTDAPGLSRTALVDAVEAELKMAQADRIIAETNDARNALESYCYDTRDALDMGLRDFATFEEREALKAELTACEDWLYGDGGDANKKTYIDRLAELRQQGDRFTRRRDAAEGRPQAFTILADCIESMRRLANNPPEDKAHLTDEDWATVRTQATEAEEWLNEKRDAQGALDITEDPIVTPEMINDRTRTMTTACNAVLSKPKPAPKPAEKEEEKTAEEGSGEAAPAEGGDAPAAAAAPEGETPPPAAAAGDAPVPPTDIELD